MGNPGVMHAFVLGKIGSRSVSMCDTGAFASGISKAFYEAGDMLCSLKTTAKS